jgi:putative transposase
VTARVSPTERIRAQIDELFASEGDLGEVLEQVARLGPACCSRPLLRRR